MECVRINFNTPFTSLPPESNLPFKNNLYPPLAYAERTENGIYLSAVVFGPMAASEPVIDRNVDTGNVIKIHVEPDFTVPKNGYRAWFIEENYQLNLPHEEVQFEVMLVVNEIGNPQDGPRTSRGTRVSVKSSVSNDTA